MLPVAKVKMVQPGQDGLPESQVRLAGDLSVESREIGQ